MKKFLLLLLLIPLVSFGQTNIQLNEIKKRDLDINSLKNIWGKLDLNDGDGYSFENFKRGDYDDNKYLLEAYIYYASKLVNGAKDNGTYYIDISAEKRKEFLKYFVNNYDKNTILLWERKEWTYSKILIENINLWEFIVKF
ncbi:hypothetical protein N9J98_03150 [Flavobacteriaceae bacterium]|nr:hypothetical protein [Flavobacteriaceae bacterium]